MLKLALLGAGRMGSQVADCVDQAPDIELTGIWSKNTRSCGAHSCVGRLADVLADADVAVDFTLPDASVEVLAAVQDRGVPLVCGVSGHSTAQRTRMEAVARTVPVLHDRNMSVGIALLNHLLEQAGRALAEDFTCEIHETHHVHKLDAPSGTALMLGETLAAVRGRRLDEIAYYNPDEPEKPGPPGAIRFVVERTGEVIGDHAVRFSSAAESLSFSHRVTDRRVFAEGAVRAARWLPGRPPGLYRMSDVLFSG